MHTELVFHYYYAAEQPGSAICIHEFVFHYYYAA